MQASCLLLFRPWTKFEIGALVCSSTVGALVSRGKEQGKSDIKTETLVDKVK